MTTFSIEGRQPAPPLKPATLRHLMQMAGIRQNAIARELGVSSPRITQLLKQRACTRKVAESFMWAIVKLQGGRKASHG